MNESPQRGEVTRVLTHPDLQCSKQPAFDWSLLPTTSVRKSVSGSQRRFPALTCAPTAAGREAEREPERPAARPLPQAGSPDRGPSAPRPAHRLDRPEAGACPPTRKADRQSDRRERTVRRSL